MAGFEEMQEALGGLDPLDVPTPGESLTANPDNPAPSEKPPQFTDKEQAIDDLFMRMTSEDSIDDFLDLMRNGVPIENVAQVVLFEGFRQGMYNPDLMLLLIEPTIYILLYLADYAGIDDVVLAPGESEGTIGMTGAVRGKASEMLEGEEGEGSIKVGDQTVARPEGVPSTLLEKIKKGETPTQAEE